VEGLRKFFYDNGPGAILVAGNEQLFGLSEPFSEVATVGPRVASNLERDAVVALFISMLGVIFYISLRFEFIFGVAAIVALLHDILICIGIVAVTDQLFGETFPVKINLAELAAVLTIIGYSINDTIVVFDRIRENKALFAKKRRPFEEIVDLSINQTLSRTLWTSITTLLVTLVLIFFATEAVRGFAFIFMLGVLAGTYSSVFIASPVLIMLHKRALARREALLQAAQA
jgi:preprotein translocase SecF subunit